MTEPQTEGGPDWRVFATPAAGVLVALVGGLALAALVLRDDAPARKLRFAPLTATGSASDPAVSPDGTRVAFAWRRDDGRGADLYVRALDSGQAAQLTDGESEDLAPAWSPDGSRIAFSRQDTSGCELLVVPSLGGAERRLAPCPDRQHLGLSWSPGGRWLAHTRRGEQGRRGLALLDVETLETRAVTRPPPGHLGDEWPAFSPDGRLLAFVRRAGASTGDVHITRLSGGDPIRVTRDGADVIGVAWSGNGRHLVFCSDRGGAYGLWSVYAAGGSAPSLVSGGDDVRLERPSSSARGDVVAYEEWDAQRRSARVMSLRRRGPTGSAR